MRQSFQPAGWWQIILGGLAGAAVVSGAPWASRGSQPAQATPIGEKFWPSEFGASDQRGAANRITPPKVVSAARLVQKGQNANLEIQEGDVVLIRTGHGKLWMKDNSTYGAGEPGIGLAAARFLTDRKVAMIGADTWAIEAVPHERPDLSYPVHQWDLTKNGVYHIENLDLEQIAEAGVHEFCFVFSPLRLKGATGSPGNPIAIR